jgi:exodeoxyribonuclease I
MNYVIYDFETSGRSSSWDQVVEVGAVLVNDEFQILADPLNLRCSLKPGLVPEPYALIINKTTPQILRRTNLSHYGLVMQMQETFSKWSPAVFLGFNNLGFDEEFLRKSLFKTLNEPYLTQYSGNKRGDILGLIRTAHLYYPDCIKTPMSDKGNAVFKLAELTEMNNIKHDNAHSALSDVMATIEIAKIIKNKAPSIWKSSLMTTSKAEVNSIVEKEKIFCVNEYFYGKARPFVVTFVCFHPKYNWPQCFDLKSDPSTYLKMPYAQLKEELKKSPKVMRSIKNNKHPVIMSPNYATNFEGYKQLGADKLLERANMIQSNKEFKDRVFKILKEEADEKEALDSQVGLMAEESIYAGGFAKPEDQKMMVDFHKSDWKGKLGLSEKFKDERFSYFAKRLIYEENPEVLGKDEYKKIHRAIAGQILSTNDEKWNTVPKAFKDIDDLRVKYDELKDEKTLGMLNDLSEYIEEIQTKYESA